MSRSAFYRTFLGLALVGIGLGGCLAGTAAKAPTTGTGGSGAVAGGAGGGGTGGVSATGTGGTGVPLPVPPGCGDGINNQGGIEQCDDGNTIAGDGCNGACHVEPNWTCPPAGACTRTSKCGDGVINPGEVCDDGNTTDGDGCNSTCTVQDGRYVCQAGQPCVLTSICGNKRVEQGENCDDGNADVERRLQLHLPGGDGVGLPGPRLAVQAGAALRGRHRPGRPGRGLRRRQHHRRRRLLVELQGDGRRLQLRSGHEVLMPDGDLRRRHPRGNREVRRRQHQQR